MDFEIPIDSILGFHPDVFDIKSDCDIIPDDDTLPLPSEQELQTPKYSTTSSEQYYQIIDLKDKHFNIESEYKSYFANLQKNHKSTTRKPKIQKPDVKKDEKYWIRRHRNTESARKSRQRSREKNKLYLEHLHTKIMELEIENKKLKLLIDELQNEHDNIKSRVMKLN